MNIQKCVDALAQGLPEPRTCTTVQAKRRSNGYRTYTYHLMDATGAQASAMHKSDLLEFLVKMRKYKHPYPVIVALLYGYNGAISACTTYHTIYTPAGKPAVPGYAIRMRLLMQGHARINDLDGGLTSARMTPERFLGAMLSEP